MNVKFTKEELLEIVKNIKKSDKYYSYLFNLINCSDKPNHLHITLEPELLKLLQQLLILQHEIVKEIGFHTVKESEEKQMMNEELQF